jgi:hypothetical protein
MVSAYQVREVVAGFVQRANLDDFVMEFSKLSFDIRNNGDPQAIEMAKNVEDQLALLHVGHLSPAELREKFRGLLRPRWTEIKVLHSSPSAWNSGSRIGITFPLLETMSDPMELQLQFQIV